jgi:hypothetical protein
MSVIRSFKDLDVYQRAYRVSLDIHRATLRFSKNRAICLGRSNATREQVDLRQSGGGICKAAGLVAGVPAISGHVGRFQRRNAGLARLWARPRLSRRKPS